MRDYLVVCLAALVASGLTLFSGFGLGKILTPVFATFFPVATAVAMTAVVHRASNLFDIGLVGSDADWPIVLRFGLFAALAAVGGAALLVRIVTRALLRHPPGRQARPGHCRHRELLRSHAESQCA
jgi:hypothetical protein